MEDRWLGVAASLETRFRFASTGKMFTAVGVLQLVETGRLSLADPVNKYLPDYALGKQITLLHLLTHTGGTGDIFDEEFVNRRLTLREHSDYFRVFAKRALLHEPGERQQYSNFGFILLGLILERASNRRYCDLLDEALLAPLGMNSTGFLPESERVPRRACGYTWKNGEWMSSQATLPWKGTAAGGGYATAMDFFRFAQALESGRLLSPQTMKAATGRQQNDYGFGFPIKDNGVM